MVKPSVY